MWRNVFRCQPESAVFCTHFSHFGYAVQLLPEKEFPYRTCGEEISKPLLLFTLLKIISRYQWYISLSILCLVLSMKGFFYLDNTTDATALLIFR